MSGLLTLNGVVGDERKQMKMARYSEGWGDSEAAMDEVRKLGYQVFQSGVDFHIKGQPPMGYLALKEWIRKIKAERNIE